MTQNHDLGILALKAYRLAGGRVHCNEIEEAIDEGILEVRKVLVFK